MPRDYTSSDATSYGYDTTSSTTPGEYLVPPRDTRMRSTGGTAVRTGSAAAAKGSARAPPAPSSPYINVLSTHELRERSFFRALAAEFFATTFFVGFSVGGVASAKANFDGALAGTEHAFLLLFHMALILIVIFSTAAISGSHFNPAVTVGTLCAGRITVLRCIGYVFAQLLGATTGAGIMIGAIPGALEGDYMGVPQPGLGVREHEALLMEFFCTFGLLFGAFAIAFDPRGWGKLGPVAIAIIVAINAHVGGFVSGAAMNPARAFGPALAHGHFRHHWLYWVGGLLGGICGATSYEFMFMNREHARTSVPATSGDARVRDICHQVCGDSCHGACEAKVAASK